MHPCRGPRGIHPGGRFEPRPSPRLPRRSPLEVRSMRASLQQAFPETWRDTFTLVASGFAWVLGLSKTVLDFALFGGSAGEIALKAVLIVLPCAVLVAGMLGTMSMLYTLPFRSGRPALLTALVMSWWDWLRMTWFYWAGLLRFLVVLLGWIWGLLKLAGAMFAK